MSNEEFKSIEEEMDMESIADEMDYECEQCREIQEEMKIFFEADGLTYTHPEE